jgi:site-specific DNA-methyltransferase (adenine-specific)
MHDGSEAIVKEFPDTKSGRSNNNAEIGEPGDITPMRRGTLISRDDDGSAARFFYCPKVSRNERNTGLDNATDKLKYTAGNYSQSPVCETCDKTLNGTNDHSNCSGKVYYRKMKSEISKNHHPTVKPVELMKYLCRLITPKGGTVLDPFMGSGSTGMAAKDEGFEFIGIEKEKEYFEIAESRIKSTAPLLDFLS